MEITTSDSGVICFKERSIGSFLFKIKPVEYLKSQRRRPTYRRLQRTMCVKRTAQEIRPWRRAAGAAARVAVVRNESVSWVHKPAFIFLNSCLVMSRLRSTGAAALIFLISAPEGSAYPSMRTQPLPAAASKRKKIYF